MTIRLRPHLLARLATLTVCAALLTTADVAADDLPKTFLALRGPLLYSEDFTEPLAPFSGQPVGFASGFRGWRYNLGTHGGHWDEIGGAFQGVENPEAHHPATASYGIDFKDAIIQCEMRLDDVADQGRRSRYLQIKTTDTKDYLVVVTLGVGGLTGRLFDDAQINPVTHQRMEVSPVHVAAPVKLGEWHSVLLEIRGEDAVGSVDGHGVALSAPIIGWDKHSVMLVAGTQGSFRHLRIWEALPNPDWPKNKAALPTPAPAPKPESK